MDEFSFRDEQVEQIAKHYVEEKSFSLSETQNPTAFVLGGLPGSGKSTLLDDISKTHNNNVLIINADEFRKYHPKFNAIVDKYGEKYPEYTAQFSGKVAERLISLGAEKKFNIAIEGTFRTAETPLDTLRKLRDKGYITQVYIKAEHESVAWGNTLKRAEFEREHTGIARTVSREHFNLVRDNIAANVDTVFKSDIADRLKVFTSDALVFDSAEPGAELMLPSVIINQIQNKNQQEETVTSETLAVQEYPEEPDAGVKNGFLSSVQESAAEVKTEKLDLSVLMNQLTHERTGNAVRYFLSGQPAFEDHSSGIYMANDEAAKTNEMVLVALQTAAVNYAGVFKITGNEEFKQRVYNLIAEYDLNVTLNDPAQREALRNIQQQHIESRHTADDVVPNATSAQTATKTESTISGKPAAQIKTPEATTQPDSKSDQKINYIRGELLDFGKAKYKHKEDEKMSYFIKIQNDRGIKEYWGVDFQRALQDAGVKRGDIINAEYLGNRKVEVSAPVRDESGKIVRYEKIMTNRNEWKIGAEYPKPTTLNPDAQRPDSFSCYDALTFNQMRERLLNAMDEINPAAQYAPYIPEQETVWFFQNGKPVPENEPKPAIPVLSDKNRLFGEIVFAQKSQNPDAGVDALFVSSRDGFLQGILRDPQTNKYEDVIAKQVTVEKDGKQKTYFTLSRVQEKEMTMIGYGHVSADHESLVYKLERSKQVQSLSIQNKDFMAMPVFRELFANSPKPQRVPSEQAEQVKRHEQKVTSQPIPTPKM